MLYVAEKNPEGADVFEGLAPALACGGEHLQGRKCQF